MSLEFRPLTREEAAAVPGMIDPIPESLFAVGAVDEKGVAAACGLFMVLHADPIWVRPELRNSGKTLLRLWEATRAEIVKHGGKGIEVGITDTNPGPPVDSLVERMCLMAGGYELKARFWAIPIVG